MARAHKFLLGLTVFTIIWLYLLIFLNLPKEINLIIKALPGWGLLIFGSYAFLTMGVDLAVL